MNVTSITDERGNTTTYTYDALNWLTALTDAEEGNYFLDETPQKRFKAIVGDDSKTVYSIRSDKYHAVQHSQIVEALVEASEETGIQVFGTLNDKGGNLNVHAFFADPDCNVDLSTAQDDPAMLGVRCFNSHNATTRFGAEIIGVRYLCSNLCSVGDVLGRMSWNHKVESKDIVSSLANLITRSVDKVPVSGYLSIPVGAKPKSLPAVISFHGAGVASAGKPLRNNAISFDVNAHGILNGQPQEYYNHLYANELRAYFHRNKNDREKFYFRNMYLRVLRALDYVKTLPEWDGKNLIVVGSSQGGAQALVAAALDPQVSLCLSGVPAMSDHSGNLLGRQSGWPRLFAAKNGKPVDVKTAEASKYYDNVNFAKYIKAPVYMTVGMIDNTCVPTSVYAVFNNLPAATEKHMTIFPTEGHVGKNPAGYKAINKVVRSKAGK